MLPRGSTFMVRELYSLLVYFLYAVIHGIVCMVFTRPSVALVRFFTPYDPGAFSLLLEVASGERRVTLLVECGCLSF